MGFIQTIDNDILAFLQGLHTPIWDSIFSFITTLGNSGAIWLVLGAVLLIFPKTRKCGLLMLITIAAGFLIGELLLKNIIMRERPFIAFPLDINSALLIPPPSGFSFPSGHTTSSFGGAVTIFLYNKKWGILALILAALIGFSRLYLYVHFPSDVLAGIILGTALAIVAFLLLDKRLKVAKNCEVNHS